MGKKNNTNPNPEEQKFREWLNKQDKQLDDYEKAVETALKIFKENDNSEYSKYESIYDIDDPEIIQKIRDKILKSQKNKDNSNRPSAALNKYKDYLEELKKNTGSVSTGGTQQISLQTDLEPLNLIVYGAPGTGKSWKINDRIKNGKKIRYVADDGVFRTTFHPDTDYSTFVGCYKPSMGQNSDIVYEFVPQIFLKAYMKAWEEYLKVKSKSNEDYRENKIPNYKHVYLIIEEINRGNCAQIFGDIFQLLDRDNEGFSQYPIIPDQDISKYYNPQEREAQNGLPEGYKNIFEDSDENTNKDSPWKDQKLNSKEFYLAFPPNFHIWATMNTSDQSLYPMDSAFKRRWDWEYVKIDPENKDKSEMAQKLIIDGKIDGKNYIIKEYFWPEVIIAINKKIKEVTKSADKQIGEFFIKSKDGKSISFKDFRNKVLFYLFNDVFKDNYNFGKEFFGNNNDNDDFLFEDLLNKEDNEQKTIVNNWFNKILGIQPKSTTPVNTDDSDNQDGQQTDSNNQDGQQTGPSTPNEEYSDEL